MEVLNLTNYIDLFETDDTASVIDRCVDLRVQAAVAICQLKSLNEMPCPRYNELASDSFYKMLEICYADAKQLYYDTLELWEQAGFTDAMFYRLYEAKLSSLRGERSAIMDQHAYNTSLASLRSYLSLSDSD